MGDKKGKFITLDLRTMDYFKNEDKTLKYFDTFEDAMVHCGIYELEDVWVCMIIENYKEK